MKGGRGQKMECAARDAGRDRQGLHAACRPGPFLQPGRAALSRAEPSHAWACACAPLPQPPEPPQPPLCCSPPKSLEVALPDG